MLSGLDAPKNKKIKLFLKTCISFLYSYYQRTYFRSVFEQIFQKQFVPRNSLQNNRHHKSLNQIASLVMY